MKNYIKNAAAILFFCALQQFAFGTIISVRLIKDKPSHCSEKPVLTFLSNGKDFKISDKAWYNGETDYEIFFELETNVQPIAAAQLQILAKGVKISRAIIGRTDVKFVQTGDQVDFKLVADTADGRHVQTSWSDPKGGPHVWFYHNWEARRNGEYLNIPYPKEALAAAYNYVLACHEMMRIMGDMDGLHQNFHGEFILLTSESSAPRAHLDFPPHWHLEHWESDYNKEYGIDWRKKQYIIPHYYLDSVGNILRCDNGITQNDIHIKSAHGPYLPGDTIVWKDAEGNPIFNQIIKQGGLYFIKPNGQEWSLRPDKQQGGNKAVWIYKGEKPIAKAIATDDGEKGETKLQVDYYSNGNKTNSWADSFKYDRFTGNKL